MVWYKQWDADAGVCVCVWCACMYVFISKLSRTLHVAGMVLGLLKMFKLTLDAKCTIFLLFRVELMQWELQFPRINDYQHHFLNISLIITRVVASDISVL